MWVVNIYCPSTSLYTRLAANRGGVRIGEDIAPADVCIACPGEPDRFAVILRSGVHGVPVGIVFRRDYPGCRLGPVTQPAAVDQVCKVRIDFGIDNDMDVVRITSIEPGAWRVGDLDGHIGTNPLDAIKACGSTGLGGGTVLICGCAVQGGGP